MYRSLIFLLLLLMDIATAVRDLFLSWDERLNNLITDVEHGSPDQCIVRDGFFSICDPLATHATFNVDRNVNHLRNHSIYCHSNGYPFLLWHRKVAKESICNVHHRKPGCHTLCRWTFTLRPFFGSLHSGENEVTLKWFRFCIPCTRCSSLLVFMCPSPIPSSNFLSPSFIHAVYLPKGCIKRKPGSQSKSTLLRDGETLYEWLGSASTGFPLLWSRIPQRLCKDLEVESFVTRILLFPGHKERNNNRLNDGVKFRTLQAWLHTLHERLQTTCLLLHQKQMLNPDDGLPFSIHFVASYCDDVMFNRLLHQTQDAVTRQRKKTVRHVSGKSFASHAAFLMMWLLGFHFQSHVRCKSCPEAPKCKSYFLNPFR